MKALITGASSGMGRDMANYFERGGKELFEEKFSSNTALNVLGVFQKNKEDVKKIVDDFNNKNKDRDILLDDFIKNLKNNKDKNGNKIIDWKLKESVKELLIDKEFKIEEFL